MDPNAALLDGITRGVRVAARAHASRGGRPYEKEMREMVIAMIQNGGIEAVNTPEINLLRADKKFPCLVTCRRWLRQWLTVGHIRPFRRTGGRPATREIRGEALIQLAFFRMVRPHARLYEVQAYLHNRFPQRDPYSKSQICRAETRLGLSRKASSRTSQEAYSQANLLRRQNYWNEVYPVGVAGQLTGDMIDIDEAGFKLESGDRKFAKVAREFRANIRGNYKKGAPGSNLIMAIGGGHNPYSFHRQYTEGSTNLERFHEYMTELIEDLNTRYPNRSFTFTMDNLNIHRNRMILDLIRDAGHRIVFRAPYWSCDGAIEYVFNTIHTHLEMDDGTVMETVDDLVNRINLIIGSIASFRRYFLHVGFQDN
jgi:hypothetical protein